jgi:hypothetical protein
MKRRDFLLSAAALPILGYKLDSKTGVRPVYAIDRLLEDVQELAEGMERELWERIPQASCWRVGAFRDHGRRLVVVLVEGYAPTGDAICYSFGFVSEDQPDLARAFEIRKTRALIELETLITGHPLA